MGYHVLCQTPGFDRYRVYGYGRLRSIPLLHLFIFNSILGLIFNCMPGLVSRNFFF